MSGDPRRRDTLPPYPGLAWSGRYDESATHRPRPVGSDYPLHWRGLDGEPETWSATWIDSGLPVEEHGHAVFDRWQGHGVVASGLTREAAIALADQLELEQERCGRRPAVCWECPGEILIRAGEGLATCQCCWACGRTWKLSEVDPCPWPAIEEAVSPQGERLLVCRSHAALWAAQVR